MKTKRFILITLFIVINVAIMLGFTAKKWFATATTATPAAASETEIHLLYTSGCRGEETQFTLDVNGELPSSYFVRWNYGDGSAAESTGKTLKSSHMYPSGGSFPMTVQIIYSVDAIFKSFSETVIIEYCGSNVSNNCCDGSFAPIPGKKYMVSAWVREDESGLKTFDNAYLTLAFGKIDDNTVVGVLGPFKAKGNIIDGWQRIEGSFEVPKTAETISVRMNNQADDHNAFFDDIRIYPFDGNMKSYVYDPITKRLVAEMDQNNYATIYEYSDEGEMIRVKKETERGILTVSESRSGTVKKDNP
ncbi:MAG TPA: hypothetical protein VLB84_00020 [Bacteroidia bacterium]|jgi:hypothetical protein|nr:hypothetical protein [Bacteroidia bacterium]